MFALFGRAVLAVLAAVAFGAAAIAQQTAPVRLVLDFAIQGQQSPFVLAADEGFYERAGVNVIVDRGYGSGDGIAKVASGAYDIAFADVGALIQFNGRQGATKVVNIFQIYDVAPTVLIALKKSNITKPSDLAGKRIASPAGASSRLLFPLFAKANGFDENSVTWVDVTPQLRETLLIQGEVDAIAATITDLVGLARLNLVEGKDLTVLRYSDYGVKLYGHGLIVRPEYAEENGELLRKVVKGTVEAWKAAIADPARSIAALKKRDPLVDEAVDRERLDVTIRNIVLTNHVRKNGFSQIDPDRLKTTIDMVTSAFNTPLVEPSEVFRGDFLPPRNELMVN